MPKKKTRDQNHVKSILLRMGDNYVEALDKLCKANRRSRREIVEILVSEAEAELKLNPAARVNPL